MLKREIKRAEDHVLKGHLEHLRGRLIFGGYGLKEIGWIKDEMRKRKDATEEQA